LLACFKIVRLGLGNYAFIGSVSAQICDAIIDAVATSSYVKDSGQFRLKATKKNNKKN
jgi:hypothetical protein